MANSTREGTGRVEADLPISLWIEVCDTQAPEIIEENEATIRSHGFDPADIKVGRVVS